MEFDLQEFKSQWNLDQTYHHVNHGSFGSVPIVVQKIQQQWRDRIQKNPVKFFSRELLGFVLEKARGMYLVYRHACAVPQ